MDKIGSKILVGEGCRKGRIVGGNATSVTVNGTPSAAGMMIIHWNSIQNGTTIQIHCMFLVAAATVVVAAATVVVSCSTSTIRTDSADARSSTAIIISTGSVRWCSSIIP